MLLFVKNALGDDLIGWCWSSAHEEVGRVAVPKDLSELLEIKLVILANIDIGEDILELLVFWEALAGLREEFLHHFEELFEGEVATSWVVPSSECVLGGNHVIMQ